MGTAWFTHRWRAFTVMAAAVICGCVQIEVAVEMLEEGGATITERVRLSEDLIVLDSRSDTDQRLTAFLERPAIEARAAQLGKGATLVRHEVADLPGGVRESRAVYTIPDIEDLRLPNPLLTYGHAARPTRLRFRPIYRPGTWPVGHMLLDMVPAEPTPRAPQPEAAPVPTPLQLQPLRDIEPIFADLVKDLQITVRLTIIERDRHGVAMPSSRTFVLLSVTDQDLDMYNGRFFENEEVMLSLLQWQLDSDTVLNHTEKFLRNPAVPVLRARRPHMSTGFLIMPSNAMFKKYFAGRPRSEGGDADNPPAPASGAK